MKIVQNTILTKYPKIGDLGKGDKLYYKLQPNGPVLELMIKSIELNYIDEKLEAMMRKNMIPKEKYCKLQYYVPGYFEKLTNMDYGESKKFQEILVTKEEKEDMVPTGYVLVPMNTSSVMFANKRHKLPGSRFFTSEMELRQWRI